MQITHIDPVTAAQVRAIVLRERSMSLSEREWHHRLRGHGYALRDSAEGRIITTLPHNVEICALG